jgi:hypothetical protein
MQDRSADVDTAPLSLPPVDHDGLSLLQRAQLLLVRIRRIYDDYVAGVPNNGVDHNGVDHNGVDSDGVDSDGVDSDGSLGI